MTDRFLFSCLIDISRFVSIYRTFALKKKSHFNSICPMTSDKKWKQINDLGDLQVIKQESNVRKALIFKHSTRCGISRMVFAKF